MSCETILTQLRSAVAGASYTDELRDTLETHNCYGFPNRPAKTPNKLLQTLQQIVINTRFRAAEGVFHYLNANKIPYAVVKGAVLSKRIYGNETARFTGDVDIILPRKYTDDIKACFLQNGFQQGRIVDDKIVPYTRRELIFQSTQSHQLAPFVTVTGNKICPFVNYDINVELFWGESGQHTDMEAFLTDTVPMVIGGIEVCTLPPEKEFVAMCLHHYKDWNSIYLLAERGVPLSHFFDVYGYLFVQKPDAQKLRDICDWLSATKYVYFCIKYASELFGTTCFNHYWKALEAPENNIRTDFYGLDENDRRLWNISLASRVFEKSFSVQFRQSLTARDREIIWLNHTMM